MKAIVIGTTDRAVLAQRELSLGTTEVSFELDPSTFDAALKDADMLYSGKGAPLPVNLKIHRLEDILTVHGELRFEAELQCALCLQEVDRAFVFPVHWTMLPTRSLRSRRFRPDEEIELSVEDLDVSFYRDDEIDLISLVREVLILEMEASPRCELDTCGAETYGAAPDETSADAAPIDPRWAALAAFKGKLPKK